MSQQSQILKPQTLNLDKGRKDLKETESFYLLNFQNWVTLNTKKTGNISKGNQFPANRPACDMQLPAGENYAVGTYYSILTNETYGFIYNSNGVHFISRINSVGDCQIVYYGDCLNLSADPKRMITQFRAFMKYDRTCRNRAGKELYFVTGDFEGSIDVEASIATNNFTTPFFDTCATETGCELISSCVPDPPSCLTGEFIWITPAERNLTNFLMNTGFQFRYRHVYYDGRASIWSKISTLFYQDGLTLNFNPDNAGRKLKLRVPVGGPQVDLIEIAVSENNSGTWRKVATIEKYKKYNSSQEMWYERGMAELENFSTTDCSFDYYFYNDSLGETIDPAEINRNFNPHPRGAQGMFSFSLKSGNNTSALAYYNYIKGNCPIDIVQAQKFRVGINPTSYLNNYLSSGLKAGGTYSFGFILTGDCGRFSFVYGTQTLNIPRTQDKNAVDFPIFYYDATGMILPDWVTSLTIVRTENQNGFELQWVVDSFTRVDGNIILKIQSLNDYNESRNFKANTVYQWVDGDRLEFIKNGPSASSIFTTAANGLLNYQILNPLSDVSGSAADFFNELVIKDDGRLSALAAGAIIELQRPKKVVDNPSYYEICANIPVENGRLVNETGNFNTFDTYFVSRQFTSGGNPVFMYVEHHSPNDLWPTIVGSKGVSDRGRAHVVNKYEDEKRYGRNVTINSPTEFNWFGSFEKTIPAQEQGDIIGVGVWDNSVGLAIGEHDNFLFQIGDDFARVGSDGVLRAAPVDALISDPEPKVSGKFGCQYDHIGSILFADGWANWVDVNRHAFVKHDFNSAKDAALGKTQLYFRVRCQELETHNRSVTNDLDKIRFCIGYNKGDETVMITIKKFRDSGINNSFKSFQQTNDTLIFYPASDDWLGYASFTPEAYSHYNLFDTEGCSFIVYLNGIPYYHPVISNKFNEFFGIAVDQVVGISINKFPEKAKRYLAMEIQSEKMWFSPEDGVVTDSPVFSSEIPPARVIKDGRKWNASFLYDKNSRGGLFNNDPAVISPDCRGYYCAVTLVRDNTLNLAYNTIDNSKRVQSSELDLIIAKFNFIESSGMTENL